MERRINPENVEDKLYLDSSWPLNNKAESFGQTNDLHEFIHKLKIQYNNLETENKELKKSLFESEQSKNKYYDIYQTAPIGYFSLNENGIISTANNTGATILGIDPHNIVDNDFTNYITSDYRNIFNETILKSLKSYESGICEVKINGKQKNIYVDIRVNPILDDKNNFKEFRVYLTNITKYKNFENELRTKYEDLLEKMNERAEELLKVNERLEKKIAKNKISDQKLRASEKREQARSEEFARVLYAVPAAVWISHDNKGLWITGNHLSYEYLNLEPGANASKSSPRSERPETFKVFKDGVEIPAEKMPVQLSSSGKEIKNFEFDFVYPDNSIRHMMGNATPLYNENGKPRGSVSVFMDVTKNKNAEIKMEKLVKELARSNKELEQFAYVTSHDLKEPLRMISSFTQLLRKRYTHKLDKDADEFIEYIVDGAQRMQLLLDDLLEYGTITTETKQYENVSLNKVVDEIINNLKLAIEESGAIINYDELPIVVANRTQMIQLFQNLISNAIKFQSDKVPEIHISSMKKGNKYIFSVQDNGIGINSKYLERIFKVFRRLHTREEYNGTGIGLSITKKIVQNHNGNIWVKSKPGEGSTFSFSLPIEPD